MRTPKKVICTEIRVKSLIKTRPVLDRFQDSSKTGSGINFFAAFFLARYFEHAVQMSCYFVHAVQKSVEHFWGVGGV